MKYSKTSPCSNCPYRKDSPIAYWSIEEFKNLQAIDKSQMGGVFGCHKNDGHVCRGFLIDQDKRNLPSINLRISLSKNEVTREYMDKLSSPSEMFDSIEEMIEANFPKG